MGDLDVLIGNEGDPLLLAKFIPTEKNHRRAMFYKAHGFSPFTDSAGMPLWSINLRSHAIVMPSVPTHILSRKEGSMLFQAQASRIAGDVAAAIAAAGALATGLASQGHTADWRVACRSPSSVSFTQRSPAACSFSRDRPSRKLRTAPTRCVPRHPRPDLAAQTFRINQLKSRLEAAHNITIVDESDIDLSRHSGESRNPVAVNVLGPGFRRVTSKKTSLSSSLPKPRTRGPCRSASVLDAPGNPAGIDPRPA